jgi:hypothetical protein
MEYVFEAPVWEWDGPAAWHFVTVPFEVTDEIDEIMRGRTGGFGSVPVEVTIGSSRWTTSLFPSKQHESFILPLKKAVRTKEGLAAGSIAAVTIVVTEGRATPA